MITRRQFLYGSSAAALTTAAGFILKQRRSTALAQVSGQVIGTTGGPVVNARVTLFTPDLLTFREARTDSAGQYTLTGISPGTYQVGACALGQEYQEVTVSVSEPGATVNFSLGPDVHPGAWAVIGSTDPETFGGTNSGTLLPDGRIFYCHDATDPILFDPATGLTSLAPSSSSEQGCHIPTLLLDGRLLLVGGGTVDDNGNFGPNEQAVRTVRAYDPANDTWENWPELREPRWYPGLARLSDGRLLLFGGGQQPNAIRTASCEILDPRRRRTRRTGSLVKAGGFGPAMLLYTGEVLCTWDPPQLYNPATGQWRATGQFVQPSRATLEGCPLSPVPPPGELPPIGDHPDHTAIFLPDGRVVAIGIRRTALGNPGSMVEFYDPATESWSLGSSPDTIRSMPEVLQLPTGKILVAGGKQEDSHGPDPINEWCQVKRTDLYDPVTGAWQRMADMGDHREYHAITLLLPDGRVLTTAGTREPGLNPPPDSNKDIEAFSPPYLFRGVRPRIDSLSATRFRPGQTLSMNVSLTNAVTSVVLIGANAISHWMDGGVPRLLRLNFSQTGDQVTAQIPGSLLQAPAGYYILFALVDDIPSEGRMVSIGP
ncbi:MAG: galactose oxidase-like domain-containing protein [Chloroflexota bacterium]